MSNIYNHGFGDKLSSRPPIGLTTIASVKTTPQILKARVRCSRPGCNRTFRRKYELHRHESSVHDRNGALFCSVWGCNRIAKPLPRKDHFQSHMRKHQTAHLFVCIFDNCRLGPLAQDELLNHLNSQHGQDECCTATEKAWLGHFRWRQTPLIDGSIRFESKSNCPLTVLGCRYEAVRSFADRGGVTFHESQHMQSHEFIDRSKAFEAIDKIMGICFWYRGLATCPICQDKFSCGKWELPGHLQEHSKEERMSKATDLVEMFRPCLAGKAEWFFHFGVNFGAMVTAELEEAGVIPKAVK